LLIFSNNQKFIRYKDRNELRDEYNPLKFGIYDIETIVFKELKEIEDKLRAIETKIKK
jgi:acyl-CoA hydrolase